MDKLNIVTSRLGVVGKVGRRLLQVYTLVLSDSSSGRINLYQQLSLEARSRCDLVRSTFGVELSLQKNQIANRMSLYFTAWQDLIRRVLVHQMTWLRSHR